MADGEDDFAAFLAEVNEAKPIEEGTEAAGPNGGSSSPATGKRARGGHSLAGRGRSAFNSHPTQCTRHTHSLTP